MRRLFTKVTTGFHQRWVHKLSNQRWDHFARLVKTEPLSTGDDRPIILFNASTRLQAMSQNAAYSMLAGLALRSNGIPVIQFACNRGLSRCVLGSNRDDYAKLPPCDHCTRQSRQVFRNIDTQWFGYEADPQLEQSITNLDVDALEKITYKDIPVGFWAVNSLRWMLRRHHLQDDEPTRMFFQAFILSAWNVYAQFFSLIKEKNPRAVVLFNGMFYPEAAARHACLENGIRVITHEVGLRPFTAFFTSGEATAYPMHIPSSFQLTSLMDEQLDTYLSKRFQGDFSMAGVRFWPQMRGLDEDFLNKASGYSRIVPVFTNVIFDTSQVHANTLFPHMFAWLDNVRQVAENHPEILFVIRAHPDESRPGKESCESVAQWVKDNHISELGNVIFVDSNEYISSYELIQRSHLVMVYNSTIGLEASLMGKPVLAGGKARFTQLNTSFYPSSREEYLDLLESLLTSEKIQIPAEFLTNARRFLYYQLYITSLEFNQFLEEDGVWKGYAKPKPFDPRLLLGENSDTIKVLLDGILNEGDFCYPL